MLITYQAKLLHKNLIAPGIYHLKFACPEDPNWSFTSGQYMIYHLPQGDGHPVRRLYSIASPENQKESLDFIIEMVPNGIGSKYVFEMKEGDMTTLQGPAGMFTYKSQERTPVFLATGTGIAPIYSMVANLLTTNDQRLTAKLYLFWGLKTCEDLYLTEEIKALMANHSFFYFKTCLSRVEDMSQVKQDWVEHTMLGRVTNGLEDLLSQRQKSFADFDYYLCGSQHVVEALREYLNEKVVPKEQVFFEKFT